MTDDEFIAVMNRHAPPALKKLRGEAIGFDPDSRTIEMQFHVDDSFCHSGDIVQGGYIAGMLDATMAHAVIAHLKEYVIVATLEIKVSYLEIARPGELTAHGHIVKLGKSIGFLEADLMDANGGLLATATSTARIIHKPPPM